MLLLLLLAHILSKYSSLSQGHTLESRAPVDSGSNINSRSLFNIVWGCLTTIFASTWVSVHPNVPPPNQGWLRRFWRRLKMMLIAVIAPELMVGFAARQLSAARKFRKEFKKRGVPISLTRGFFISMGGFVSPGGHPIVTIKQLTENAEYMLAIHDVKAEDISDKSKGDAFSKGIALLQGAWFVMQCLARMHQHLPITQLEVATLAFAVVNVLIWALWWAKPLDVGEPIMVGSAEELDEAGPTITPLALVEKFIGVLDGYYPAYLPITSTSVPTFWSMDWTEANYADISIPICIGCLVGTIFGAIHCAAWDADFPSTIEKWMWRSCSLMVAATPAAIGLAVAFSKVAFSNEPTRGAVISATLVSISGIIGLVLFPLYPIARPFLITIPFTSLRALPPGAFIDVDWSIYIPHL
ncbi:hypothetical protein C8R44DRAFT_732019 [Mycena epipterygia]|nr:hypothetical protein C8R44DRAFT_732019 [Mycena epipterygia]